MHLKTRATATVAFAMMMAITPTALATIYQCQAQGHTVFSDTPCGDNARTIEVDPVRTGGRLDQGTQVDFYQPPARADRSSANTGCPAGYIQSSDLRRFRVQKRIQEGMSEAQVRYILGDPERQDGQWWVYERRGEETGRYHFRGGCLIRWR